MAFLSKELAVTMYVCMYVCFNGISTFDGYLMPNPVYMYEF